jgi:DNA helicase-2/ATP-dependent DNA helicase PcrA
MDKLEDHLMNLNDQQRNAIEKLNGRVLVMASAGTGKTRVLISRVLKLIENNVSENKIFCVTFTNRAAKEISERLNKFNVKLQWVGTFHGLCLRILRKYGNLNKNTIIIDDFDQIKIMDLLGFGSLVNIAGKVSLFKEGIVRDESILNIVNEYNSYLERNNMLDFADLINKTIELLQDEEIGNRIKERFNYFLVDEYQDTSTKQNLFLNLISEKNKNIFYVGDDDQSIYGWRGANVQNIIKLSEEQDVSVYYLEKNYRSTKTIVELANHVISNNKNRILKNPWSELVGEKIKVCSTINEGEFIANEIINLLKQNNDENIGILTRTVSMIENIKQELIKKGIRFAVKGGIKFANRLEIKTILSYIKTIFYDDILSFQYIANVPKRGIGNKKLEQILNLIQEGNSIEESLKQVGQKEFMENLQKIRLIAESSPREIIQSIITTFDLTSMFTEEKMKNVNILLNQSREFTNIRDFIDESISSDDEEKERVTFMTIHGSKGLEFDNIFVPGCVEGNFPNYRALNESPEEERRLAFVAFTRAKRRLFISYNITMSHFKSNFSNRPSRFLQNIPRDLVHFMVF